MGQRKEKGKGQKEMLGTRKWREIKAEKGGRDRGKMMRNQGKKGRRGYGKNGRER